MMSARDTKGFSLVEILVVVTIMVMLLAIGTTFISGKAAQRRSVEEVTNNISSMLQTGKLMSLRDGVEYRVIFAKCDNIDDTDPDCPTCGKYTDYKAGDKEISLIMERGDSNTGSTKWCMQSEHSRRFQSDLDLTASDNLGEEGQPLDFAFVPTGMRRDFGTDVNNETLTISPGSDAKIKNCGFISVSPAGGISVTEGNWNGSQCNPIRD